MNPNSFRARLLAGEWLSGTFINLGSSLTAEIAARAGFDWLMLDYEHGPGSEETLLGQLQAVSGFGAATVVRIAENDAPRFKRALDLGSGGVMVPYVNDAAQARAAVDSVRFPPHGTRGVSKFNRAAGFGFGFEDYYQNAHKNLVTMAQIETPEALDNLDEIAAVDGIDVLFVGPLDLSTNLGIQGQFEHPSFVAARQKVSAAARKAGKVAGILATAPAQIPVLRSEGYTAVALGSDGGAVASGLHQTLAALRSF